LERKQVLLNAAIARVERIIPSGLKRRAPHKIERITFHLKPENRTIEMQTGSWGLHSEHVAPSHNSRVTIAVSICERFINGCEQNGTDTCFCPIYDTATDTVGEMMIGTEIEGWVGSSPILAAPRILTSPREARGLTA
jgi:hypothetical protein